MYSRRPQNETFFLTPLDQGVVIEALRAAAQRVEIHSSSYLRVADQIAETAIGNPGDLQCFEKPESLYILGALTLAADFRNDAAQHVLERVHD